MQLSSYPIITDFVLIGGGHSHAIALSMLGLNPIPGLRLTLITNAIDTPYSGMLPGHIAGIYSHDQTHIDLRRLARFAGAQLYLDRAIGLDLDNSQVICADRPPVAFDYLSIDIGSTPTTLSVPGAAEYAIPVKPVPQFLQIWQQIVQDLRQHPERPLTLGIVGGGAGGVELALNMQANLHQRLQNAEQPLDNLTLHLVHRGERLLESHNRWVGQRFQWILSDRQINLHLSENVREVTRDRTGDRHVRLRCESGLTLECDRLFWVTQASAPTWIQASGLATDDRGFILVGETLQSISHPRIFATGDIATMQHHQRPKAGVFAVRQGKPLFENLGRIISGKPLKRYIPQKRYLSLIGTGDGAAIASWSCFGWQSPLLWDWKDRIDRQFMERFEQLPVPRDRQISQPRKINSKIPTSLSNGETGVKVNPTIFKRVLQRLNLHDCPDDAAIIALDTIRESSFLVQSIDRLSCSLNDPFLFGQIATHHCLNNLWAMGATAQSALAIATVPQGSSIKVEETLYQLLCGAVQVLQESETALVGGHTTQGEELTLGLACQGIVEGDRGLLKSGMQPGQVLLLTKALGTGTLLAGDRRYQAKGVWIDRAIESMLLSNKTAANILLEVGATACTDIDEFGLLGNLIEMIEASDVAIELKIEAIPSLSGAKETLALGITQAPHAQNRQAASQIHPLSQEQNLSNFPLLFDPQTSGGLLATIPIENATLCLKALRAAGYQHSQIIGRVKERKGGQTTVEFILNHEKFAFQI